MTSIPAKVLKVHKLFNEYLLTVQVGRDNFAGKFDRLQFEAEPSDTSGGVACFPQLWTNGGDIFRIYHDFLLDRHAAESVRLGKRRSLRSRRVSRRFVRPSNSTRRGNQKFEQLSHRRLRLAPTLFS
jgi:hypothetical protein